MAFTGVGFDGTVGEAEFAEMVGSLGEHGVMGAYQGTALSATKVAGSRQLLIQPGKVFVPGVFGNLDVATNSPAGSSLGGALSRIDLVVARFVWSTNTVSLQTLEGTPNAIPVAPTPTQTPGTTFEVPLADAVLDPGSAEYKTNFVTDRRYWISPGKILVPPGGILPGPRAGLVAQRIGSKDFLVGTGTDWQTFQAVDDTGWQTIITAPAGFTGSTQARRRDGVVWLNFLWQKNATPITNASFTITIPTGWRPSTDIGFNLVVQAPNGTARVYVDSASGNMAVSGLTMNANSALNAVLSYPL